MSLYSRRQALVYEGKPSGLTQKLSSYLSLICVMGRGSSADKRVLIDYNAGILHDALLQIFKV